MTRATSPERDFCGRAQQTFYNITVGVTLVVIWVHTQRYAAANMYVNLLWVTPRDRCVRGRVRC